MHRPTSLHSGREGQWVRLQPSLTVPISRPPLNPQGACSSMATLALDQQQLGGLHRLPPVQTVISCSGVQASARGASSDEEEQACGFVGIGAQPAHVASHPIHAPTPRGAEAGLTASFSVDSSGLDAACIASRAAVAATQGVDKVSQCCCCCLDFHSLHALPTTPIGGLPGRQGCVIAGETKQ